MPEDNKNSAFNPASEPSEMKVGLFGRIMGQKHQQNLRKESRSVEFLMDQLKSATADPGKYPPEVVEMLITNAGKYLGPEIKASLKQHFDQLNAKRDVERRQAMLPGHEQKPQQQGGMAEALGGGAAQPESAPDAAPGGMFSPMHKSQLLQLAVEAQKQGNPSMAMAPTPGPQGPPQSPGLPQPPSEAGGPAGAAPAQPNPAPAMIAKSSALGANGFNVRPPAPAQPDGGGWFNSPAQRGTNAGAMEGAKAIATGQAIRSKYGDDPRYKDLSGAQSLEFETGRNIPSIPTFQTSGIAMSKPGDMDRNNSPVEEGTPGKYVSFQGKTFFEPEPGSQRFEKRLNPDGTVSVVPVNRFTGKAGAVDPSTTSAPRVRTVSITMPDGTTHQVGVTQTGQWASDDPRLRGVNPAMLPSESNVVKLVTQVDGSTQLVPVTETRGKVGGVPSMTPPPSAIAPGGAPAAGAPVTGSPAMPPAAVPPVAAPTAPRRPGPARAGAPGAVVGGRPMTPEQMLKSSQQAEMLNNTIGVIKDLQVRLPSLANLVTAGKISLQVDPHQGIIKSIINKTMPMTDEEAALAADWQQMTEGVMQMRIPMGGAGFRGPEGMAAIQSLKGNLGQSTKIMKLVLEGTLREFKAQRDPLVAAGGKYKFKVDPEFEAGFRKPAGPAPGGITAPPASLPSVTTEAEYKALPKGAQYTYNGETLTKK